MRDLSLRSIPFLIIAGTIFYLSSLPSPEVPDFGFSGEDKLLHTIAYLTLALASRPLAGWVMRCRSDRAKAWTAFLFAVSFGVTDEFHQLSVAGRSCELYDWMADCLGALIAVWIILRFGGVVQRWYRHRFTHRAGS